MRMHVAVPAERLKLTGAAPLAQHRPPFLEPLPEPTFTHHLGLQQ
jgi:hypothetical protein